MDWKQYWEETSPRLAKREEGFRKIFEYLDEIAEPTILETGGLREPGNWAGDGQSSVLFDTYISHNGGKFLSIDNDADTCAKTRAATFITNIYHQDSVECLGQMRGKVDCLYLDSYNVDWNNDWAAACHHLKELLAARLLLKEGTLIIVDDNITHPATKQKIGKGRVIHETMEALGIPLFIDSYQLGWIWTELSN